ncbi:MAG: ATPase involved in replication control Cdc46/Mcm family [Candidatus Methanohalarchaeum thermophilum]|uniref:ATPase involved in replication control Cdc46/Mcm family n=1 Tax=Methanohalarchaeum thermophilum TaxID=1903181 RepID=A0A1Q6DRW3_METT1|nr:MAG: ATPase involved in replication control Cdc46/Mcm family [Candidatus Methanohalarchaeum thermophilum]
MSNRVNQKTRDQDQDQGYKTNLITDTSILELKEREKFLKNTLDVDEINWLNAKQVDSEEIRAIAPYETNDQKKVNYLDKRFWSDYETVKATASKKESTGIALTYQSNFIPVTREIIDQIDQIDQDKDIESKSVELNLILEQYLDQDQENGFGREVKVADLNADLIGKEVVANVQVAGSKTQKAIPREFHEKCLACGWEGQIHDLTENIELLKNYLLGSKKDWEKIVDPYKCRSENCNRKKAATYREKGNIDYSILFVRDLIENQGKFEESSYETNKVYLIDQTVPRSKKVTIKGTVIREPETRDISIVATEIEPYEDILEDFELTERDKKDFEKHFQEKDPWSLKDQVAPDMVGRPFVKLSRLLVLHSVAEIPFLEGKIDRGCLREVLFGDTTTYKSASIKDITKENYNFGPLIHGNTSKRTGLLYSIDSDNKTLKWGEIPLNDLGYIGLDEMHSLNSEEINQLRTALREQTVKVSQMVSGEAKTRTRVSATFNPGKKANKAMNEYLYNCQAIEDTWIFESAPDIARWDIYIPFCNGDVDTSKIADRDTSRDQRPIPPQVFKRHIYWAWSRKPEHIEYTQETKETIKDLSKSFMDRYSFSKLPIVNDSFRKRLTRLSVAAAALDHSIGQDHEKVVVEPKHVEFSIRFYEQMLDQLDYLAHKEQVENKKGLSTEEYTSLIDEIEEIHVKILYSLSGGAKSSKELAEEFDKSAKTIRRKYRDLKKHDLMRTRAGVGAELTPKGVTFLDKQRKENIDGNDGTEDFVAKNGTMSQEKSGNAEENGKLLDFRTDFGTMSQGNNKTESEEESNSQKPTDIRTKNGTKSKQPSTKNEDNQPDVKTIDLSDQEPKTSQREIQQEINKALIDGTYKRKIIKQISNKLNTDKKRVKKQLDKIQGQKYITDKYGKITLLE